MSGMRSRRPGWLLAACLMVILALLVRTLTPTPGTRVTASSPLNSAPSKAKPEKERHEPMADTRNPVIPVFQETLGSFLQEHWGADWIETMPRYTEHGIDLKKPLTETELKPWSEVDEQARALARTYYERDLQLLRSSFLNRVEDRDNFLKSLGVDESQMESARSAIRLEVSELDSELEALSTQFIAAMDAAMAVVLSRETERYPLLDLRAKNPTPGAGRYAIQVEKDGWFVTYRCSYADFPILGDIDKEKRSLLEKRMQRIRAVVHR